ncbi:MAG: hypothetical protein HYR85_12120 [Planctomycetes bacterium]|nr:hypothetical protein [Planctomycetota bacterium]MBI3844627.1 hypothetical protein [Planctomycetota bacterium]
MSTIPRITTRVTAPGTWTKRFESVRVESLAIHMPDRRVTSLEIKRKILPIYERLGIPLGTLERVTGVESRCFWRDGIAPSEAATFAARAALDRVAFDAACIQALFSCSITRDFFEPATACIVHHALGLPESAFVLDVTNGSLGFLDGLVLLSSLIESRVVRAGIVVSGEANWRTVGTCIDDIEQLALLGREVVIHSCVRS